MNSNLAQADHGLESAFSNEAQRVHQALLEHGLETPMTPQQFDRDEKYRRIRKSFSDIATTLGLDLSDDSLQDTPHRIARMYVDETYAGLDYLNFPRMSAIDNKMGLDEMVKVSDISLTSSCEHHFVTIDGSARVAYIPGAKIVGLSKINRIARFFAQRPQVQERLTQQIMVALQTLLETDDVAVSVDAVHFCVRARGVRDIGSRTQTSALGGVFRNDRQVRAEFMA